MLHVFVTGVGRSGTTLVDRVISSHPDAWIASQPLPLLYVEIKREFHRLMGCEGRGVEGAYPLTDLFGDHRVDPDRFLQFVRGFELDRDLVVRVLDLLDRYSGRYFVPPDPRSVLEGFTPCGLLELVTRYLALARDPAPAGIIGSKETWCEEFIPYYLGAGARVIWVVRDPRDVLASLHFGRGKKFAGDARPILFVLRQWRKSVAVALAEAQTKGMVSLRYEDLVQSPDETIGKLGVELGFDDLGKFAGGAFVPDDDDGEWRANSSFEEHIQGIDPRGVGRFKHHLSRETDLLVQATCFPELKILGYQLEIDPDDVPRIVTEFADDGPIERKDLAYYRWSPIRAAEEQQRWTCFRDRCFDQRYCLSRRAFQMMIGNEESESRR